MASADAIRLVEIANRGRQAVARDRALAEDDEAFRSLAQDGADLYEALIAVLEDKEFWDRLRGAARGNALLPREERDALEMLLETELPAVFEALRYSPPPKVETLVEATLLAVARVLESQLSPAARVRRIKSLEFELGVFCNHLHQLVNDWAPEAPPSSRYRLFAAVSGGSSTAVALAITAAGIGAEAGFGAFGAGAAAAKLGGKAGELLAEAMTRRAREQLIDPAQADAEIDMLADIDPAARVKTFARLLESRLARAAAAEELDEDALDAAAGDLRRLARAVSRTDNGSLGPAIDEAEQCLRASRRALTRRKPDLACDSLRRALDAAEWLRARTDYAEGGRPIREG